MPCSTTSLCIFFYYALVIFELKNMSPTKGFTQIKNKFLVIIASCNVSISTLRRMSVPIVIEMPMTPFHGASWTKLSPMLILMCEFFS
jgi:hypothetical protein